MAFNSLSQAALPPHSISPRSPPPLSLYLRHRSPSPYIRGTVNGKPAVLAYRFHQRPPPPRSPPRSFLRDANRSSNQRDPQFPKQSSWYTTAAVSTTKEVARPSKKTVKSRLAKKVISDANSSLPPIFPLPGESFGPHGATKVSNTRPVSMEVSQPSDATVSRGDGEKMQSIENGVVDGQKERTCELSEMSKDESYRKENAGNVGGKKVDGDASVIGGGGVDLGTGIDVSEEAVLSLQVSDTQLDAVAWMSTSASGLSEVSDGGVVVGEMSDGGQRGEEEMHRGKGAPGTSTDCEEVNIKTNNLRIGEWKARSHIINDSTFHINNEVRASPTITNILIQPTTGVDPQLVYYDSTTTSTTHMHPIMGEATRYGCTLCGPPPLFGSSTFVTTRGPPCNNEFLFSGDRGLGTATDLNPESWDGRILTPPGPGCQYPTATSTMQPSFEDFPPPLSPYYALQNRLPLHSPPLVPPTGLSGSTLLAATQSSLSPHASSFIPVHVELQRCDELQPPHGLHFQAQQRNMVDTGTLPIQKVHQGFNNCSQGTTISPPDSQPMYTTQHPPFNCSSLGLENLAAPCQPHAARHQWETGRPDCEKWGQVVDYTFSLPSSLTYSLPSNGYPSRDGGGDHLYRSTVHMDDGDAIRCCDKADVTIGGNQTAPTLRASQGAVPTDSLKRSLPYSRISPLFGAQEGVTMAMSQDAEGNQRRRQVPTEIHPHHLPHHLDMWSLVQPNSRS
eukprot:GHVN01066611.1.p1 GENE.GHVN01066611.1~~GHVN01066611.1.p1  ORF type:complete len:861 (-),score=173.97 GHVN01066611.1:7778-9973(-)